MKFLLFLVAIIILKTTKAESSFSIAPKKVETKIKAVQDGKKFLFLTKESMKTILIPDESDCWLNTVKRLNVTCSTVSTTVSEQQRLAISFLNCLQLSAGKLPFKCTKDQDIKSCLNPMNSIELGTYNAYLLHVVNLCYYLSNELFNDSIVKNINNLLETSQTVSKSMNSLMTTTTDVEKST
jgi:hypothetical protein